MGDLFQSGAAIISDCGQYRYRLSRRWADGPTCGFIMLNPSTADANLDDPTIRRCIGFAKREGCGGLIVINLFALRATDPKELARHPFPVGPEWRQHMEAAVRDIDGPLIAGWGAQKGIEAQEATVRDLLCGMGRRPWCLGWTANGCPRHPLYVKGDAPMYLLWAAP
jgi:hypothetical protein